MEYYIKKNGTDFLRAKKGNNVAYAKIEGLRTPFIKQEGYIVERVDRTVTGLIKRSFIHKRNFEKEYMPFNPALYNPAHVLATIDSFIEEVRPTLSATGKDIVINDITSDGYIKNFRITQQYSTQAGTPAPDSPVPILSSGDEGAINIYCSRLPSAYTEVEYIESHGTQALSTLLNTPATGGVSLDLEVTVQFTQNSPTRQLMGADYGNYFGVMANSSNYELAGVSTSIPCTSDDYDILRFTNDGSGHLELFKNGVSIKTHTATTTPIKPIYLFDIALDGGVGCYAKLKNAKIKIGGVLVRNFIPCFRNTDNVIGMYDLINNAFYINRGTGSFTKGNTVVTPITLPTGYVGGSLPNGVFDTDEEMKLGKLVLNGSESFQDTSIRTDTIRTLLPLNGVDYSSMCTHLIRLTTVYNSDLVGHYLEANYLIFSFPKSIVGNTLASLKTWLSTNNVTVYYQLATPTPITLTKPQIELSEGINYITTTNDVKADLTVEYRK